MIEKLCALALEEGFTHAAPLSVDTLVLQQEVRDMCAACSQYGTRWSCPPGCGQLEELRQKLRQYSRGILVQSVGQLEDNFDAETMMETEALQKERLLQLQKRLPELVTGALILGAGCCTHCKSCTYPDAPCRFPEKMLSSMEAWGLVVSQVCMANNVKYYYGPLTIAYTSCILIP